jgi:NDP-sugar pyrophosphorylase family protein
MFVVDHGESKADVSVVVVPPDGRNDCGLVLLDQADKLERSEEKQGPFHSRYVNAGIYLMSRRTLYDIPIGVKVALERELFPPWVKEGNSIRVFVYSADA